jgi:hypothetical protein
MNRCNNLFPIDLQNKLSNDKCFIKRKNKQNELLYKYSAPNYKHACENKYSKNVERGSLLLNGKYGNILTHDGEKRVFNTENYFLPPYMGESYLDADVLSRNYFGEMTHGREIRRGVEINRFVPLIPAIRAEIQNPVHLIPEFWVNGGMDTRTVIRNIDYMKTCGLKVDS